MDSQARAELLKKVKQSGNVPGYDNPAGWPDPYWHKQRQKLWMEALTRYPTPFDEEATAAADAAVVSFDERFGKKQADPT